MIKIKKKNINRIETKSDFDPNPDDNVNKIYDSYLRQYNIYVLVPVDLKHTDIGNNNTTRAHSHRMYIEIHRDTS